MHTIGRGLQIAWREFWRTFTYRGSRGGSVLLALSALFLSFALSDFFAQPQYEGQFVGSFLFTFVVVMIYVTIATAFRRARSARLKRDQ